LHNKELLEVDKNRINKIEEKIKQLIQYKKNERKTTYEEILKDIKHLKFISLKKMLSSYPKMLESLSKRLNKNLKPVEIVGDALVPENFKAFTKTLVHVFRNSIDHGIEPENMRKGKDKQASITCTISQENNKVILSIADDGKGLDEEKIKQKALEKNLFSQQELDNKSKEEIFGIIFMDNFSTKEEVSDLSGRGIGLGALKAEVEKLNGKIIVQSEKNKGSLFQFVFYID